MIFIDFMKQLLALFGGEAIESTTRKNQEKNAEKELQEKIDLFLERKSVENGRYSITEEYEALPSSSRSMPQKSDYL